MGPSIDNALKVRQKAIEFVTVAIMAYEDGSDLTADAAGAIGMLDSLAVEIEFWCKEDLISLGLCILSLLIASIDRFASMEQLQGFIEDAGMGLAVGYGS